MSIPKKCETLTTKLIQDPMNGIFVSPVDPVADGIPDYFDVIKKPMCLLEVQRKLENHEYKTSSQWYLDVCLIYENAIKYHNPNIIWHQIAQYMLDKFKQLAYGLDVTTQTEWIRRIFVQAAELSPLMARKNLQQSRSSNPQQDLKAFDKNATHTPEEIAELVPKLNKILADRNESRQDIFGLLKDVEGIRPDVIGEGPIDAEKLTTKTINYLFAYVQAKTG